MCVYRVSYEFCFNGAVICPIVLKRGLRQGDPLSALKDCRNLLLGLLIQELFMVFKSVLLP